MTASQSGSKPIDPHLRLAAHELRSPLAAIRGAADYLVNEAGSLPPDQAELVRMVHRNALRMQRLIEDILLLGRIDRGEVSIRFDEVAIDSVLRAAIASSSRLAEERGILFEMDEALDGLALTTDYSLISTVFDKLIDNAARYASGGTTVRVQRESRAGIKTVSIVDEGPGIPVEQREIIFERFHRAADAHHEATGAGLGLALARGVSELLGYRLLLEESADGRGSRFSVCLGT